MSNSEEWENTPEYQELRLCVERKGEIEIMINSLNLAESNRMKEEKILISKLREKCASKGHFFGEEELQEVDDGIGREEYKDWVADERDDYCDMGGGPAQLTGEWVTKTRDYQRKKMVFKKTCKCCRITSQRDAKKEIKVEYT